MTQCANQGYRRRGLILAMLAVATVLTAVALAPPPAVAQAVAADEGRTLARATLVATTGTKVRLDRLAQSSRAVILSLTFLGCRGVCPTSDLIMLNLEDRLASVPRADVELVTLSVDPFNDTAYALARRAREIGSTARRHWLTGAPADVFTVLDALGVNFGATEDHPGAFFIITDAGRRIERVDGAPDPTHLLTRAESRR